MNIEDSTLTVAAVAAPVGIAILKAAFDYLIEASKRTNKHSKIEWLAKPDTLGVFADGSDERQGLVNYARDLTLARLFEVDLTPVQWKQSFTYSKLTSLRLDKAVAAAHWRSEHPKLSLNVLHVWAQLTRGMAYMSMLSGLLLIGVAAVGYLLPDQPFAFFVRDVKHCLVVLIGGFSYVFFGGQLYQYCVKVANALRFAQFTVQHQQQQVTESDLGCDDKHLS